MKFNNQKTFCLTDFLINFLEIGKELGVKDTNFAVKLLELAVSNDGVSILLDLVNELREQGNVVFIRFRELINRRCLLPSGSSRGL